VSAERAGVRTRLDGDPHISPAGQALIAKALGEFIGQHALLSASGTHAP
jgi:hypothetical protein